MRDSVIGFVVIALIGGSLAEEDLAPLPGMTTFPKDLRSFWPDAEVRLGDG